ncbi:cuticular protein RR-2 motif 98 precursor, partial [Danaus plexippus plexippus]
MSTGIPLSKPMR